MTGSPATLREELRFWSKVDRSGGDDACWNWQAYKNSAGYGRLGYRYRSTLAHRFAWLVTHFSLPSELCVCHRCDNPACVNPKHLFLGTKADNNADMAAKNRACRTVRADNRGERHGMAKLSESDVRAIRAAEGSHSAIGRQFGVSRRAVSMIRKFQRWAHVDDR